MLPRFGQIVTGYTHGVKTIDVIITSCPELYSVPKLSAPVLPDNPLRAKPSDHKVPVARPLAATGVAAVNTYEERVCRPLPEFGRPDFMKWAHSDVWGTMSDKDDPTKLFAEFQKLFQEKVNFLLPEKRIRITKKDKEFITAELNKLDRLFYEVSVGLAVPGAEIMNKIAQTGIWPHQLKTEWGVPLEKQKGAKNESETRLISCTNKMIFIVVEKQVIQWLMNYVGKELD